MNTHYDLSHYYFFYSFDFFVSQVNSIRATITCKENEREVAVYKPFSVQSRKKLVLRL